MLGGSEGECEIGGVFWSQVGGKKETIDLEGSVGEERCYGGEERPETVGRGKGVWRGGNEGVTVEAEIVEKTGICAVEEGTQLVGSNVVEGEGGEGEGGEGGRNLGKRGKRGLRRG